MDEEPELWEPLCEYITLHPLYYDVFRESTAQLFYGDGPLPREYRHFIALMAATRHDCEYLSEVHSSEFLRMGGDLEWLRKGLAVVPLKLRKLDELNRLLAHQPWLVTVHHLFALTRCSSPDNWSLSELMHGAIILSHTHSIASFVKGCGIISSQPPSPHAPGEDPKPRSSSDGQPKSSPRRAKDENSGPDDDDPFSTSPIRPLSEVELLMARMRRLTEPSVSQPDPEEVSRQFEQLISNDHKGLAGTRSTPRSASSSLRKEPQTQPLYSDQPGFQYVDFVKRDQPQLYPTFKIHDYSWEDQGYSLVSQLYGEFSALIDRKFRLTQSLTYYTMGKNEGVDTGPFRTAIWNYIQGLFGIRHDDYDYHQVNELLQRRLKELVKTVCCYPHRTTDSTRKGVMTEFLHSERVHVMLLVAEARQQSQLLYFLRAVNTFMTN